MQDDIDMSQPLEPPPEVGETLCVIPHANGRDRVRVSVERIHGGPRLLLRLQGWTLSPEGQDWPWKGRSISLRGDQVEDLIIALERFGNVAGGLLAAPPDDERESYNPYGHSPRRGELR